MVSELTPTRQTPTHTCTHIRSQVWTSTHTHTYACRGSATRQVPVTHRPLQIQYLCSLGVVLEARQCTGGGDVEGRVALYCQRRASCVVMLVYQRRGKSVEVGCTSTCAGAWRRGRNGVLQRRTHEAHRGVRVEWDNAQQGGFYGNGEEQSCLRDNVSRPTCHMSIR